MQVNLIIDCELEAPNEDTAKQMVRNNLKHVQGNYYHYDEKVIDIDFISIKESEGIVDLWEYRKNRET